MIEMLTGLLVVITGIYAFFTLRILKANERVVEVMRRQLDVARDASTGQNILNLLTFIQDERTQDARRIVHDRKETFRQTEWSDLSDKDKRIVSRVCSTYDILGIMLKYQVISTESFGDPFKENWRWSIKECYETLERHILEIQSERHTASKDYWKHFTWLYKKVL